MVSAQDSFFTYVSKLLIDEAIVPGDSSRLMELSFSYFDRTPLGWIMSRVTSDSGKIAEPVTWGLVDITWALMNITTSFIFMSIINWRLALIVLAVMPIMVLVSVQFQRLILAEYRQVRKLNSKLTGVYSEMISGVRVIKALCRKEKNLDEFSDLARVWASMQSTLASAERIFSLTDSVPEVRDRESSYDPGSILKVISFEQVNFSYEEGKPVLQGFNLQIQPGERIALVGPAGGGKSTIINLICCFYEQQFRLAKSTLA